MNLRNAFDHTFRIEAWIAVGVFVLVAVILAVALVRGRARPGRSPSRRANHPRLETAAFSLLLCVAVFLAWTDVSTNNAEGGTLGRPTTVVEVTAHQWCWTFHYEGHPVTVTASCVNGRYPTMVLPTNRIVRINVTSTDVIHGFWVPYLRFKTYAMPDHISSFEVDLKHTGSWPGRCAAFCGLYHATMDFRVRVVSAHTFSGWLEQKATTSRVSS